MNISRGIREIRTALLFGFAAITAACSPGTGGLPIAQEHHPPASTNAVAADSSMTDPATRSRARALLGKLPLYFIENRGQEDPRVAYYVQGRDTAVYFARTGVTFAVTGLAAEGAESDRASGGLPVRRAALAAERPSRERWAVNLDFVGATAVVPHGEQPTAAVVSYFTSGEGHSQTGLRTYGKIVYPELWPGIDLMYYGTAGHLKYTFLVKPGADPDRIQLAYRGATGVTLTDAGQLAISTPVGGFTDDRPYAYQEGRGGRDEVPAAFAMVASKADGVQGYGFKVGQYDRSRPLVLDPSVLVYAGYIGGAGAEEARGIAVDAVGNAYVVGSTNSSVPSFPAKVGPDLIFNGGSNDVFVAKVKADGSDLVYLGYIGGEGDDVGKGIAVDKAGNAYVTGSTGSDETTFPVKVGPRLTHGGGDDAFVAKVNAAGTGLVYCGYIGGAGDDDGRGIAVDAAGNAYVAGTTESDETTFPVKLGPDLTYNGGFSDVFVAKVKADGAALVYAGYIGGADYDEGRGIAVDSAGNAYVTGFTGSDQTSFPVKVGPDVTYNLGIQDAFVAKVKADGTALIYAGYIGGDGDFDFGEAIAVDSAGNAYVAGFTDSDETTFPVKVGPGLIHGGADDAFVAKVKSDGSGFVYVGYIGGAGNDAAFGIAVDAAGSAYITGDTDSDETTFPVKAVPGLIFRGGINDTFVAKVTPDGSGLAYAGYIGGAGEDSGRAIAVDVVGNVYVAGSTDSDQSTFPVTVGPDLTFSGSGDAFVAKLSGKPDLAESAVFVLPVVAKPGGTLTVFDTASNLALGTAKASTTRYYLSADTVKSVSDIPLGGSRAVPTLLPGASHQGSATVTIPTGTALGSYRVLACADDGKVNAELDESTNCVAGNAVQVTLPDLVETGVSNLPQTAPAGGKFIVTDDAANLGAVAAAASTTRYYLSKDSSKNAGDVLLIGTRAVPALGSSGQAISFSSGSELATIPSTVAAGIYRVLACADDTNVIKETLETNNCIASVGTVQVTR